MEKKVANVSERLKLAMKDAQCSQSELSRMTRIDRAAISRYLSGATEKNILFRICVCDIIYAVAIRGIKEMERVSTTAERLRTVMNARGMKQIDLVRDSGLPKGAISLYVSGKVNPKQAAIEKISKTLDVNALWLMGYDVPMTVEVDPEAVRNQAIADIALRMQTDDRYRDVVIRLDKLDRKKLDAVAAIVESMQ